MGSYNNEMERKKKGEREGCVYKEGKKSTHRGRALFPILCKDSTRIGFIGGDGEGIALRFL